MLKWFKETFLSVPLTSLEIEGVIERAIAQEKKYLEACEYFDKRAKEIEKEESLAKDLILIQSMQKLEITDGDIIVIKSQFVLSPSAHERLEVDIQSAIDKFGFSVHVLVLEEGMTLVY